MATAREKHIYSTSLFDGCRKGEGGRRAGPDMQIFEMTGGLGTIKSNSIIIFLGFFLYVVVDNLMSNEFFFEFSFHSEWEMHRSKLKQAVTVTGYTHTYTLTHSHTHKLKRIQIQYSSFFPRLNLINQSCVFFSPKYFFKNFSNFLFY